MSMLLLLVRWTSVYYDSQPPLYPEKRSLQHQNSDLACCPAHDIAEKQSRQNGLSKSTHAQKLLSNKRGGPAITYYNFLSHRFLHTKNSS